MIRLRHPAALVVGRQVEWAAVHMEGEAGTLQTPRAVGPHQIPHACSAGALSPELLALLLGLEQWLRCDGMHMHTHVRTCVCVCMERGGCKTFGAVCLIEKNDRCCLCSDQARATMVSRHRVQPQKAVCWHVSLLVGNKNNQPSPPWQTIPSLPNKENFPGYPAV